MCFSIHVGERHHEGYHVKLAADQQWEDLTELGTPVHPLIPRSQCAELYHQLGWWPGSQQHPTPLQVRRDHMCGGCWSPKCSLYWVELNSYSKAPSCAVLWYLLLSDEFSALSWRCVFDICPLTLEVNHTEHRPRPSNATRNQGLEIRNGRCVGTILCVRVCEWREVRLTGQCLLGVCTLLDLLCLRLPCHCLHTLGVCMYAVVCERNGAREASGVSPLFCKTHTHTHSSLWAVRKASVGLDLGQGLGGSLNTHIPHSTGLNTSLSCTTKGRGIHIFFLPKFRRR